MKKIKYVIGSFLIVAACIYLLFPISEEAAMARAKDELAFYCNDLDVSCSRFISKGMVSEKDGQRIYEWTDAEDAHSVLQIRIPFMRVGDLTFGFVGKDVTLGTRKKE